MKSVVATEWTKFARNLSAYSDKENYKKLKREIDAKLKELENLVNSVYNSNTNTNTNTKTPASQYTSNFSLL